MIWDLHLFYIHFYCTVHDKYNTYSTLTIKTTYDTVKQILSLMADLDEENFSYTMPVKKYESGTFDGKIRMP